MAINIPVGYVKASNTDVYDRFGDAETVDPVADDFQGLFLGPGHDLAHLVLDLVVGPFAGGEAVLQVERIALAGSLSPGEPRAPPKT